MTDLSPLWALTPIGAVLLWYVIVQRKRYEDAVARGRRSRVRDMGIYRADRQR